VVAAAREHMYAAGLSGVVTVNQLSGNVLQNSPLRTNGTPTFYGVTRG